MKRVRREAYARAGLLGNPSDLYDGRVIALALANFRASVAIEPAASFEIVPGADDRVAYPSLREAAAALDAYGCDDGVRLLRAALRKTVELRGGLGDFAGGDPRLSFRADGRTGEYLAKRFEDAPTRARIRALLREKYGLRDRWVGLFVDQSRSLVVRLVPVRP